MGASAQIASTTVADAWTPSSWQAAFQRRSSPTGPTAATLDRALKQSPASRRSSSPARRARLQASLAEVAAGNAFLLQAGDCAESFEEFSAVNIREKLRVILQMAVVLTYSLGVPVVKVGRIAGQFAKPRSSADRDESATSTCRSSAATSSTAPAPTAAARIPDPERLVQAYHQSASTLNLVRAFTKGGFADLNRVHAWTQEFVATSPEGQKYEQLAAEIDRALQLHAGLRRRHRVEPPTCTRSTCSPATRRCCSATRRR